MIYQSLVRDFADRTKRNLEVLRGLKARGSDVYEVTAVMNSMLGLLIFPQQTFCDSLPETPIAELVENGWPIPAVEGEYPQARDLCALVRYLRNAMAHCNVQFTADNRGEINGLVVWNTAKGGRKTWQARLTMSDLEGITDRFIALLLEGGSESR